MAEASPAADEDRRPTIVFLHGTALTGAAWTAQVAALDGEFHCLAPDLPGHGTAADVLFSVDAAAERVAELITREAHDGRAILVGLSLGGYIAMTVAARWPERIAGLAIVGATADPVGIQSLGFRALAVVFDLPPRRLVERVYRATLRLRYPAEISEPILDRGVWLDSGVVALRALAGRRFSPALAAYPGPSLLVNGEFDLFFRPTEAAFARVAADPRRVLIRRATHLSNLDQPARFSAAIRRFATAVGGADRTR